MIRFAIAAALALIGAPAVAAVEIQEVTSDGGIDAWLVEESSIPFVSIELRFRGGAALDPRDKRGAVNLMMALLEEGSGDMDARAFAEAQESLAASYGFDTFDDAVSISAQFLTENRDEAVALLRQALIEPRFDDDAIERVRGQVLSIIRSDATDPNSIAQQRFDQLVFGDHPYGASRDGTLESVAAISREDLVKAHRRVLTRSNLFVGAAGDISAAELGALLDELLSELPAGEAVKIADAPYALDGGQTLVPFDTPQSVAFFGQPGIQRDDPDFFPAFLANEIFGGSGRQSRLSDEVREKRGLTYGIGTYLVEPDGAPMLLGQTATENARMAESLDIIRKEWQRVVDDGFTGDELDEVKTYLTGAYPLRFDGNGPIARIMVGMQMNGLPVDYIATRNDKVNAVTLSDVNRVASELYDPDRLHFVVVGRPEGIDAGN
jgi:zinc protease